MEKKKEGFQECAFKESVFQRETTVEKIFRGFSKSVFFTSGNTFFPESVQLFPIILQTHVQPSRYDFTFLWTCF